MTAFRHKKLTCADSSDIPTTEAASLIANTCSAVMTITPPVGGQITVRCKTIGFHSERLLLVEVPDLKSRDMKPFVNEGYWVRMKIFTGRGKGSVLQFRSQIAHVMTEPLPMVVLSLPTSMNRSEIRVAPRFDTSINITLSSPGQNLKGRMTDLSKFGCQVEVSLLSRQISVGELLEVTLDSASYEAEVMPVLKGVIKNSSKNYSGYRYGLEFETDSHKAAASLLAAMSFDGNKLTLG